MGIIQYDIVTDVGTHSDPMASDMIPQDEARQKKTAAKGVCQMLGHDFTHINTPKPYSGIDEWVRFCVRCGVPFDGHSGKEVEFST